MFLYIIEEVRGYSPSSLYSIRSKATAVIPSVVMATFDYVSASFERRLLLATPLRGCFYVEICGKVSLSPSSSSRKTMSNQWRRTGPFASDWTSCDNRQWNWRVWTVCFELLLVCKGRYFRREVFLCGKLSELVWNGISSGGKVSFSFAGMVWLVKRLTN